MDNDFPDPVLIYSKALFQVPSIVVVVVVVLLSCFLIVLTNHVQPPVFCPCTCLCSF